MNTEQKCDCCGWDDSGYSHEPQCSTRHTEQKCCEKCRSDIIFDTYPPLIPCKDKKCLCHTEQKGWREEFDKQFKNFCCSGEYCSQEEHNEHDKTRLVHFIERTLQAQREADREELVRRIEDLKWTITMDDLHGQVKDGHHYVRVKHVNAKLLALKSQVAALIKDTKPL